MSVHGTGPPDNPKQNSQDLPTCTYCHANRILKPAKLVPGQGQEIAQEVLDRCLGCHEDERWTRTYYSHLTHRMKQRRSSEEMVQLCASCHEDEQKMQRHGLEATGTFRDTFHWQAIKYGNEHAPNCIDCHAPVGYFSHEIMPKTDAGSAIHKDNLVQTCSNPNGLQQCHPAATPAFAQGKIHPSGAKAQRFDTRLDSFEMKEKIRKGELKPFKTLLDERAQQEMTTLEFYQYMLLVVIKYFYKILIGVLIGCMAVHQMLDFYSSRRELHARKAPPDRPVAGAEEKHYVRMNLHERIQHHLVWTTFILLALTGFMVELPEEWVAVFGDAKNTVFYWRGLVHRCAALVMVLNVFYQLWYMFGTEPGRRYLKDMLPTLKDGKDVLRNMRYYLRLRENKPLFGRFSYKEKLEYWTGQAGTAIITLTGVILWAAHLFPKFAIDVSILVHTMEAILASCAIMVWHFYEVHLKPGKFPLSTVFLNGRISGHELKEEHPLEYRRIKERENAAAE